MAEPIDLHTNTPPTAIVEKTKGGNGVEKVVQDINTNLAIKGLKIEIQKTQEEQENDVKSVLLSKTLKKVIDEGYYKKSIEVKKIEDGVFAVISIDKGNVTSYSDSEGKIILSVSGYRNSNFIDKVFEDMDIAEVKKDKEFVMHRVNGYKDLSNGQKEPVLGEVINKKSKEYFNIWKNIAFYSDVYDKLYMLKTNMNFDDKLLKYFIKGGALTYDDLELFKSKGLLDETLFKLGIEEFKKVIVSQCSDIRLIKLRIGIKESDIKKYLDKGYIDSELALKCYESLPLEMRDLSKK
ncbi:MAG: hypothetical protein PHZ26_00280 [Candidatus Gracilibacteria bacterium]|nr:hypothetical protein [Candidatus Gracilibacteria bacterium]MDD2908173.1 hypothetical protein [Candidatus Gracilibacteria bacterium]